MVYDILLCSSSLTGGVSHSATGQSDFQPALLSSKVDFKPVQQISCWQ